MTPSQRQMVEELEKTIAMVARRRHAQQQSLGYERSQQIDLGDRCFQMGLATAVGLITGEQKETVVDRVTATAIPRRTKAKVVRRRSTAAPKKRIVRRKK